MGKNFVPPTNRRSPVVKAVKLMAWNKAFAHVVVTLKDGTS